MGSSLLLDLGNNYIDDKIITDLSEQELVSLSTENIPWFDRWVPKKTDQKLKNFSDYTDLAVISGTILILADKDWFVNLLIMGELIQAQSAVGKWFKTISGRNRPYTYADGIDQRKKSNQHSFYSLHSSSAFAAARLAQYYYQEKGGDSIVIPALLYSTALTTGILRIAAGQHFLSDVIVGAFMGIVISNTVIKMHKVKTLNLDLTTNYIGLKYRF